MVVKEEEMGEKKVKNDTKGEQVASPNVSFFENRAPIEVVYLPIA